VDYHAQGFQPRDCYPDSFKPIYAREEAGEGLADSVWADSNVALEIGKPDGFAVAIFPDKGTWQAAEAKPDFPQGLTVVQNPDDTVSVWFKWPRWESGFNCHLQAYDCRILCRNYLVPAPPSRVGDRECTFIREAPLQEWDLDASAAKPTIVRPFSLQAISLRGLQAFSPPSVATYIAGGLMDEQGKTLIAGIPKIGKSRLALNLAFALATGMPFLGLQTLAFPRVLMIQFEVSEWRFRQRVLSVANAWKIPMDNDLPLYFLTLPSLRLDSRVGLIEIKKLIRTFRAEVVILDPMVKIHTGDEKEQSEMQHLLNTIDELIDELNISVVLVHHLNKASDAEAWARIRGSSYIPGWADSLLILDRASAEAKPLVRAFLRNGEDWTRSIEFKPNHTIEVLGDIETAMEISVQEAFFHDPNCTRRDLALKVSKQYNVDINEVFGVMRGMENKGVVLPK
jgi:hypothetical protein